MYDLLSTAGKIISRGSRGSTRAKPEVLPRLPREIIYIIYLILCLSHSDKSCQSIKNCKASYCSPEGSKGAVQHDAINWLASKLSQRKIVATSGETLPAIVTDMNNS